MLPLVPANVDLRDFAFMPIDVHRLLTSETWVLGTGDERAAAMTLWLVSWHQVPAGSLPENDRMLSHLSQAKTWTKVREHALRGWQIADDSRLYHPIVAEKVLEAWLEKLAQRLSSGAGNAKRWNVEFDPKPIEREMQAARVILSTLNPQSRTLSKKRTSGIPSGSKTIPTGNPKVIPSGSQETETGTGIVKDQKLPATPGGDPPPAADPIWGTGLAFLLRKGIPEPAARSLLGKVRKAAGDVEAGAILARAEIEDVTNPIPWILTAASNAKARVGPISTVGHGKTAQAIQALEDMKHGNRLGVGRDFNGDAKAPAALVGEHASG